MLSHLMKNGVGVGSVLFATAFVATPSLATATSQVPVVTRDIDRGAIISEADISLREMDLSRMPRGAMLDKQDLIGLEALRNIRSGKPVRSGHVRVPPLARGGQDLTILFRSPGMQLTATGRALEDGHKGDTIRVMNSASKEIIDALVTDDGTVVVQR